jgi:hypothetical protein
VNHHYLAGLLRWVLTNFLPGLASNGNLPDLQIAGITDTIPDGAFAVFECFIVAKCGLNNM